MVWREARRSYRRFLFFLFCVAIGVGSIVGVGNIAANLEAMTLHEARGLLAGDLEARLFRPLSTQGKSALADLAQKGVRYIRVTELIGMAMSKDSSQSLLVELKAVEPGYPFYGRLKLDPPNPDPFINPDAVWVQEALLIRLHLKVGDRLKLGDASFTIRGIVRKEPDQVAGPFSLGPRVLLSQTGLSRTGLIQPGSRVTRRYLFRVQPPWTPESLKAELSKRWSAESVQVRTYREAQPRLGRFLKNFTTYLGLVGWVTLMIGGIGVAISIHAFLAGRIGTIAILKCLGSPSSSIQLIYLLLALILGGIGGLLGIGLGIGIHHALGSLLADFLPPDFPSHSMPLPALRGMAMGLLATLLFTLWPLRIIRRIPPLRVFRQEAEIEQRGVPDRAGWLLAIGLILGWVGLSVWQAGSWRLGGWVTAAVGLSVLLLLAAASGMLRLMKQISRRLASRLPSVPGSLILRYGIGNLHRPGRLIVTIILSVGIGVMILLAVSQVEQSLLLHLNRNIPKEAPSFFFIDLQPDQKGPFEAMMKKWEFRNPPRLTPLVRSRLYEINGKKVSEMKTEDRPDRWYFTREYVLTFQKDLPEHNSLLRGTWWTERSKPIPPNGTPLISVEEEAARHLGIDLGSTVTFDIQGRRISAKVASIRDVDWGSLSTNFFFIFSPGALDGEPITYVATVTTRPEEDLPLQNAVIGAFPNVTAIHLREILETITGFLKEIVRAVRFMAFFGLLVGLLILSTAIAATRFRRIHEMVLLKTLGATRPTLIAIMAVEYGLLGLVAALVGGLLSIGLSWGIVRFFFDIPWRFDPSLLLTGLIVTVVLTLLTGFLATYRILGQKPLAVLRSE
jgi:putative ABC transport system permease protein